jgi:hypothetical protein
MLKAGWSGTNVAAYETDFLHNLMTGAPEFRENYGDGEQFMRGIDAACAERNMTVQLCAGNVPSFFVSLTMPTMTQARASIDYDWATGDPGINGGWCGMICRVTFIPLIR